MSEAMTCRCDALTAELSAAAQAASLALHAQTQELQQQAAAQQATLVADVLDSVQAALVNAADLCQVCSVSTHAS